MEKRRTKLTILFLVGLILVGTFYFGINNYVESNIEYPNGFEILLSTNTEKTDLPDIYYIILDEYAGFKSLEKNFGFDNSKFYSELSQRGFFIPSKSYSNYPFTVMSIPSSLNMQYLNFFSEKLGTENTDLDPIREILEKNLVMNNLSSNGYYIVSFFGGTEAIGSKKFVDEKICGDNYYLNEVMNILTPAETYQEKRNEILCTFDEIGNVKERISQPMFVFAHISIPHKPFVFDENGDSQMIDYNDLDDSTKKKFYLQQLKFANKMTIRTIDEIFAKSETDTIIIIQSDHGERTGINWNEPTEDMIKQGLNNLNAYYFPNEKKNKLYNNISPVNTFRIIFNEYFDSDFELLDDRYYWIKSDKKPYDVKDVTEIIDKFG